MNHLRTPRATAVAAALLLAGAAGAQTQPALDSLLAEPLAQLQMAQAGMEHEFMVGDGPEAMLLSAGELGPQRVVKGAPYCAEAVHETVQWLADGAGGTPNRIVRQQTSRLCRDSDGRTRQEIERGARKLVYLRDPVTRESWLLDPERKTARRLAGALGHDAMGGFDAGAMREFSERMREWARGFADSARSGRPAPAMPPTPPTAPTAPTPPTPATAATPAAAPAPVLITRGDDGQRLTERRVLRLPPGAEGPGGDWAQPPPVQWRANNLAPRGGGSVSPLPARELEGLRANGERTTWVIEAGKVGNEKPIQITREVWTSPELMLTLSSRDFDPRSGELNYRLKAIKRGEPDAALMRVPADFKPPGRPGGKASQPTG